MQRYIKHRLMLENNKIRLAFLTLLVLFAVSTSVWAGQPPPNDDCEDAIAVGVPSMTESTTTNSTADTAPDCGGDGEPVNTTPGVWYTVVGTGNTMAASTCNETTDYDTELSVYCHECDDLTCIDGNDDNECDLKSDVFWCSQAGATYRVFVHGHDGATGNFGLDISDDGTPCEGAIECPIPRDINVRVIAICAAPVGVEPHDGGDGEVCLCFGPRSNGFNATGIQRNGKCARSQVGPFCFVDTLVGPLFWKETVTNQTGPTTVVPGQIVPISVPCPPGKMVLSCQGEVLVGDTTEVAANVSSNKFPTEDGLACRHVARTDLPPPDPCAGLGECPCDFDAIPKTACCWVKPTQPSWNTAANSCVLQGQETSAGVAGTDCFANEFTSNCEGTGQNQSGLTGPQVTACQCKLEQYATALDEVADVTVNNGPPYDCTPP